jgi:hypothetical protein
MHLLLEHELDDDFDLPLPVLERRAIDRQDGVDIDVLVEIDVALNATDDLWPAKLIDLPSNTSAQIIGG